MSSAALYSDDRGLNYGDGLFETVRVSAGRAPLWSRHRDRLALGAQRLGIPFPASLVDSQFAAQMSKADQAVIKLVLTRGRGGRGYSAPKQTQPTLLVQQHPLRLPALQHCQDGISVGICDIRLASQPVLAGIKHLNRLEQVMARRQVDQAGWDEGLLLGGNGEPLELTAMNLFARFGEQLWTPDLGLAGVAGVMRSYLIDQLAPEMGLSVRVASGTLSQLRNADELFACNSVAGILPVRKLALWNWPVGDLTRALQGRVSQMFSGG
ncbi:MAG: aminodeoxychorismate lyase [Alcanivoracaceae bacterium]|jgi:4-amino-4-deoxychorismate lyase|nr:aminodeoxychorismate lyase [Alcanivoracaceae bacterium]